MGRIRHEVATAALVINCVGPESDYRRIEQKLVRNLMRRRLIRPGPAYLGVDALPNGAIIGQNGAASDVLYTLGSSMKGVLWEVLAVPTAARCFFDSCSLASGLYNPANAAGWVLRPSITGQYPER